jgi:hypothetical protein
LPNNFPLSAQSITQWFVAYGICSTASTCTG